MSEPKPVVLTPKELARIRRLLGAKTVSEVRVPALGPCLVWKGARFIHGGYGKIWLRGRQAKAHRLALLVATGNDSGLVCHRCDQPDCVNPDHLVVADDAWNNRDKAAKGRASRLHGESNGFCKFPRAVIDALLSDWSTGRYTRADLARKYGMNWSNVNFIVKGIHRKYA